MNKKGQAAMEFIMTYGWAILAAVIAIGVLAYMGIFSPGKFMPSSCSLSSPLGCDEHAVTTTGVTFVVRNGVGDSITTSNISVINCADDLASHTIADGSTYTATLACTPSAGSKFKGDITVTYKKSGGTLDQRSTGQMTAKVA